MMHKLFLSALFLLLGNACVIGGIPLDQRLIDIQGLREVFPSEVQPSFSISYRTRGMGNRYDTISYNDAYGRYNQGFNLTFWNNYYENRLYLTSVSSYNFFYNRLPYITKIYDYTGTLINIIGYKNLGDIYSSPLSTRESFMMIYIFITLPTGEVVYLRGTDIHVHFLYDGW